MIGAAVRLDGQTTVSPQLPLGAKTMRRLQYAQHLRRPDRANRGNFAELFPGLLFLARGGMGMVERINAGQRATVDARHEH